MAFVPAANTVMCELRYLMGGVQAENTLYYRRTSGTVTPGVLQSIGSALVGWWAAGIAPLVSNQLELNEVYMTDLTTATSITGTFAPTVPVFGSDTADPLPNNVSLAVSFRTAGRGRSSRGRNYIFGLTDSDASGSRINGPVVNSIQTAYASLIPLLVDEAFEWVVVSRFTNGNPRSQALVQPITGVVVVDDVVDSQRRRLPGRGR